MVIRWKLQFTNVLLAAVNPGTQPFLCIALLQKRLTIHRKLSESIASVESVISAELSIVVVEGSVTIFVVAAVETISQLPKIAERF